MELYTGRLVLANAALAKNDPNFYNAATVIWSSGTTGSPYPMNLLMQEVRTPPGWHASCNPVPTSLREVRALQSGWMPGGTIPFSLDVVMPRVRTPQQQQQDTQSILGGLR